MSHYLCSECNILFWDFGEIDNKPDLEEGVNYLQPYRRIDIGVILYNLLISPDLEEILNQLPPRRIAIGTK